MRVLHVVRGMANSSGTTHIVGPLAKAQAELGAFPRILFVDRPGEPSVLPDPVSVPSRSFPMGMPKIRNAQWRHFGWSPSFRDAIEKEVAAADFVHIHAIWNFPTWWSMRTSFRKGVPYGVSPQGSLEPWALKRSPGLKKFYGALAEKRYFDRASAMIVLTDAEQQQCREFGITAPCRILPNGIDFDTVDQTADAPREVRRRLAIPDDAIVFLFLGRLFPKKGLDVLIPAFGTLIRRHPHAYLIVAGHDSGTGYLRVLKEMATGSCSSKQIQFVGEVQGTTKFDLLRASDVFVLPSYSEGLPIAALEALACARPVIITPGCHIPEVSLEMAGWVAHPTEKDVLSAMETAIGKKDQWEAMGKNARILAGKRYEWSQVARASLECYGTHQGTRVHMQ